jgi:molybdopterin converting factor small subunit
MDTQPTSPATSPIRVRVRAFAQLRELLDAGDFEVALPAGSTLVDLWECLRERNRKIDALASSTRLARNGRVAALPGEVLADGDEVALLPPAGGG